jgi:hypothetical protein
LATRLERAELDVADALLECPPAVRELARVARLVRARVLRARDVTRGPARDPPDAGTPGGLRVDDALRPRSRLDRCHEVVRLRFVPRMPGNESGASVEEPRVVRDDPFGLDELVVRAPRPRRRSVEIVRE